LYKFWKSDKAVVKIDEIVKYLKVGRPGALPRGAAESLGAYSNNVRFFNDYCNE
jgi:hypothetical protein